MPVLARERAARLTIDLSNELRRRIRIAAARHDSSIRDYVVQAILARLSEEDERTGLTALDEATDPVLGALWKNDVDAIYDDL
jgi:plasmid stability protein